MNKKECIWYDRTRHLGLPISFSKYYIKDDRLFIERGFFTTNIDEILLYRIRDVSVKITLGQKIFGVGTITVISSDKTNPTLEIKNIKNPREIKEILHKNIEQMKDKKRIKVGEVLEDNVGPHGATYDGDDEGNDNFEE